MTAIEGKLGVAVVIEIPCLPVARVMTGFAFGAERAFVLVVLLVTRHAFAFCIFESRC